MIEPRQRQVLLLDCAPLDNFQMKQVTTNVITEKNCQG
jgi:hypothetical protein